MLFRFIACCGAMTFTAAMVYSIIDHAVISAILCALIAALALTQAIEGNGESK